MIVDDDPNLGVQLQSDIEDAGHEVTDVASSVEIATDLFEPYAPDCALIDIQLFNGPNGLRVGRYLADLGIPYGYISADRDSATHDQKPRASQQAPNLPRPGRRAGVDGG